MEPLFLKAAFIFIIYLVSLLKRNYGTYAGKQIYGELARSTAIGLLHTHLYQDQFQY